MPSDNYITNCSDLFSKVNCFKIERYTCIKPEYKNMHLIGNLNLFTFSYCCETPFSFGYLLSRHVRRVDEEVDMDNLTGRVN